MRARLCIVAGLSIPNSITANRCQGRTRRIFKDTPSPLFWFPKVRNVLPWEARMSAKTSLTVVFPTLPVIAINVVLNSSLRHSEAKGTKTGLHRFTSGGRATCLIHSSTVRRFMNTSSITLHIYVLHRRHWRKIASSERVVNTGYKCAPQCLIRDTPFLSPQGTRRGGGRVLTSDFSRWCRSAGGHFLCR